jgi:hypothetical protein
MHWFMRWFMYWFVRWFMYWFMIWFMYWFVRVQRIPKKKSLSGSLPESYSGDGRYFESTGSAIASSYMFLTESSL